MRVWCQTRTVSPKNESGRDELNSRGPLEACDRNRRVAVTGEHCHADASAWRNRYSNLNIRDWEILGDGALSSANVGKVVSMQLFRCPSVQYRGVHT